MQMITDHQEFSLKEAMSNMIAMRTFWVSVLKWNLFSFQDHVYELLNTIDACQCYFDIVSAYFFCCFVCHIKKNT